MTSGWDWEQKSTGMGYTPSDVQKSGTGQYGYFADQPEHVKIYLANLQQTIRISEEGAARSRAIQSHPRTHSPRRVARPAKAIDESARAETRSSPWPRIFLIGIFLASIIAAVTPLGPSSLRALAYAVASDESLSEGFIEELYLEEGVSQLATIPSSRLFNSHLSGSAPDWAGLSKVQKNAVRAAWLRYTRDPTAFNSMEARHQSFYLAAFDGYLLAEGSTCERPYALADRGKIYLTGLAGVDDSERARRVWNEGAALCPTYPALAALAALNGMNSHRFSASLEQLAVQLEAFQRRHPGRF